MNFYEIDMNIDDLAKFIFKENVNNVPIELNLEGIESNKDLFYFCLDLFCKGLVILYGNNNSISIENITYEQFHVIQQKLKCAGINISLDMQDTNIHVIDKNKSTLNLQELNDEPNNKNLQDYKFKAINNNKLFIISFSLVHIKI